jgi:hypothetical protein
MLNCIEAKLLSSPPTKKEKENQEQLKEERKIRNN